MENAVAKRYLTRPNLLLAGLGLVFFLLEWVPGVVGEYGYFIDELYYLPCADHLALGYVDHPPLSIFVLAAVRALLGDGLTALRLVPALVGAVTVVTVGLLARRLGADTFGQAIAAGAAMIAPVYHVTFSFFSMNAFSILLWTLSFWILIEIELRQEPRLWLLFGALTGVALLNKHTFVLLLAGLAVGMALTGARRHFLSRWLWLGGAVAFCIVLPNLVWQATNGWPSLEFYRNADLYKNVPTPPPMVLLQQILVMNPGALPVWLAGLFFLLGRPATVKTTRRPFAHLGWLYVALLILMLIAQKSRPDRISDAYTVLLAAGGVALGAASERRRWLRWALPAALVACGVALLPIGLCVLPPSTTAAYSSALGAVPQSEKGEGKRSALPQHFADRLGWELLADDVEAVARRLRPDERRRAIILAPSYGQAGAIELHGRGRGLPPVFAVQNNYFHWGPPEDPVSAAILVGPFTEETARWLFHDVELARVHDCEDCMPWRDEVPIWLARHPKVRFAEIWPELRHYE
jgi:4-amino-4-deoxy-L-arabinose transferase-like glycosyltransferase